MARLLRIARRYWIVTLTIAIGLFGLVLAVSGAGAAVPWIFSAYALAVAVWQAVGMVRDILRGHWGLDILAVTAIVATVLVGEYVAALLVVLMLTGGEALEDYANRRAKRELDALLTRAPQIAHRMEGDEIVEVRADEVRPGDVLLVRPSELVPVDATLRSADAAFDESSITGESVPVAKQAGDTVLSGSVNGQAAVGRLHGAALRAVADRASAPREAVARSHWTGAFWRSARRETLGGHEAESGTLRRPCPRPGSAHPRRADHGGRSSFAAPVLDADRRHSRHDRWQALVDPRDADHLTQELVLQRVWKQ